MVKDDKQSEWNEWQKALTIVSRKYQLLLYIQSANSICGMLPSSLRRKRRWGLRGNRWRNLRREKGIWRPNQSSGRWWLGTRGTSWGIISRSGGRRRRRFTIPFWLLRLWWKFWDLKLCYTVEAWWVMFRLVGMSWRVCRWRVSSLVLFRRSHSILQICHRRWQACRWRWRTSEVILLLKSRWYFTKWPVLILQTI